MDGHSITTRFFNFNINECYARLATSLPSHTSLFKQWPRDGDYERSQLPNYLSIATMTSQGPNITDASYIFMGLPVHVIENDYLHMNIKNNLQSTGLSIHFHGFEMSNAVEYDGVVGLNQCAIPPHGKFGYKFKVEEKEGLYWYHTHSGNLGVDSHNMIKGPLIVHPDTLGSHKLVDELNSFITKDQLGPVVDYRPLLSYGHERILFFSDGFVKSDSMLEMTYLGGLNPPVQYNDDGFVTANMEHEFGTLNGKLREVIHVVSGGVYKFRLLNGGSHFAYRISIDNLPLKVVAADSHPVIPQEVDEVILHTGERFDVEVTIPSDLSFGERVWIRADTLESRKQGYQNGIRAVLHITENIIIESDDHVLDPDEDIAKAWKPAEERRTMNCYSRLEREAASKTRKGSCLSITNLRSPNALQNHIHKPSADEKNNTGETHFEVPVRIVDFDFNPAPLHAHFTRVQHGKWFQNVIGSETPYFNADHNFHPNTAIMNVPSHTPVIIIWRSKGLMEHPMHLHGYKMEILETFAPKPDTCNLVKCELADVFDSKSKINQLKKIEVGSRPIKDTFIMPGGGAVATRIFTRGPAPWLAHCHTEVHRNDGMSFIMNVGEYAPPSEGSRLPLDFPSCKTPFHEKQYKQPYCDCYIDNDAVLGLTLDGTYKCSRQYLCMWQHSQVALLNKNENNVGSRFKLLSLHTTPGWIISLSFVIFVAAVTFCFSFFVPWYYSKMSPRSEKPPIKSDPYTELYSKSNEKPSFWAQMKVLLSLRWTEYRPTTINVLRVVEVTGLGLLTGFLFYDVGKNSTALGLGEKTSLLFFSTTLWCQTRMYPAISNYFEFKKCDLLLVKESKGDFLPIFLSRLLVVSACEAWWPFLFVFSAYPLASMFGDYTKVLTIATFLVFNNSCYIAIGALLGTLMPTVNLGMIGATLFGQTTVICAGFFTELPSFVGWIRYISPIFYAFKGIVKTAYSWDDTYSCPKGFSIVGVNECFLEMSPVIDAYKQRGINVATFGDPSSSKIHLEALMMVLLYFTCQLFMYIQFKLVLLRKDEQAQHAAFDDKFERTLHIDYDH